MGIQIHCLVNDQDMVLLIDQYLILILQMLSLLKNNENLLAVLSTLPGC